jgi:hypothetical protein
MKQKKIIPISIVTMDPDFPTFRWAKYPEGENNNFYLMINIYLRLTPSRQKSYENGKLLTNALSTSIFEKQRVYQIFRLNLSEINKKIIFSSILTTF